MQGVQLGFPSWRSLSSWVIAGRGRQASSSTLEWFSLGSGPHSVYHSLSWGAGLASLTHYWDRQHSELSLSYFTWLPGLSSPTKQLPQLQSKASHLVSMHTGRCVWEQGSGGIACTMSQAQLSQQQKITQMINWDTCESENKSQVHCLHHKYVSIPISSLFPCPSALSKRKDWSLGPACSAHDPGPQP